MTKLEGVQEILRRCGYGVPSALDTGQASLTAFAELALDNAEMEIQSDSWPHNKRTSVTLEPILFAITNASWTESTKTLAQTGAFANAVAGQTLTLNSDAGVTAGDYTVSSVAIDGNSVVLATDINAGGDIASGITGTAKNNRILVPTGCLEIDTADSDAGRDLTQLGNHLFDRDNNTELFDDGVICNYTLRYDFDCIPYKLQQYLVAIAAEEFYVQNVRPQNYAHLQRLQKNTRDAKTRAHQYANEASDINVLQTREVLQMKGGRRRYSGGEDENFA